MGNDMENKHFECKKSLSAAYEKHAKNIEAINKEYLREIKEITKAFGINYFTKKYKNEAREHIFWDCKDFAKCYAFEEAFITNYIIEMFVLDFEDEKEYEA